MRLRLIGSLCSLVIAVSLSCQFACAAPSVSTGTQTDALREKDKELPQTGVLSSSIQTNSGKVAEQLPWGGVDQQGNSSAPITAQVLRDGDKWRLRVFNNSELRYTFTIRVEQLNKDSKSLRSDSFSFTLPAKGAADRLISMAYEAAGTRVVMAGWKREEKKVEPTAVPQEATPPAA